MLRLMGSEGWVELNPAYAYHGIQLRHARLEAGRETIDLPAIEEGDQFALEMDRMTECVRSGRTPYSPGEEGLQDQRITEAIYASARAGGRAMRLTLPEGTWRGAQPTSGLG